MHHIQHWLFSTKHTQSNRSHDNMTSLSFADFQIQNLSIFLAVFPWYVTAPIVCFTTFRPFATPRSQKHTPMLPFSLPFAGVCSVGARGNMGLRMMQACCSCIGHPFQCRLVLVRGKLLGEGFVVKAQSQRQSAVYSNFTVTDRSHHT
jgi:hypothetical protein